MERSSTTKQAIALGPIASSLLLAALAATACAPEEWTMGEYSWDDSRADSAGSRTAQTCKPLPSRDEIDAPTLESPRIVLSLDGLTARLVDGEWSRTYPVGVGALSGDRSLTPVGEFHTSGNPREAPDHEGIETGRYYPCRVWWYSRETGRSYPSFSGLPFIRLLRNGQPTHYGMHGPAHQTWESDGGLLPRGYVSHGCVRMDPADISELYVLVLDYVRRTGEGVPVTIQQEVDVDEEGIPVAPHSIWVGDPCVEDLDCSYEGGTCLPIPGAGYGFCAIDWDCAEPCRDMDGRAGTACVESTDADVCVTRSSTTHNRACRSYPDLAERRVRRSDGARVTVCLPDGWRFPGDPSFESCGDWQAAHLRCIDELRQTSSSPTWRLAGDCLESLGAFRPDASCETPCAEPGADWEAGERGVCSESSDCSGEPVSGLCSGPSSVQCCFEGV